MLESGKKIDREGISYQYMYHSKNRKVRSTRFPKKKGVPVRSGGYHYFHHTKFSYRGFLPKPGDEKYYNIVVVLEYSVLYIRVLILGLKIRSGMLGSISNLYKM